MYANALLDSYYGDGADGRNGANLLRLDWSASCMFLAAAACNVSNCEHCQVVPRLRCRMLLIKHETCV